MKSQNQYSEIQFFNNDSKFKPDDLVCYCFGFTRKDIEQDLTQNGQSTIAAKIASEKRSGDCDCVNKNPKGR